MEAEKRRQLEDVMEGPNNVRGNKNQNKIYNGRFEMLGVAGRGKKTVPDSVNCLSVGPAGL